MENPMKASNENERVRPLNFAPSKKVRPLNMAAVAAALGAEPVSPMPASGSPLVRSLGRVELMRRREVAGIFSP